MEGTNVWQHRIHGIFGVWLTASPVILGYPDPLGAAALNAYVCGTVITLLALVARDRPRASLSWGSLGVAVWLLVAPLPLGYADQAIPVWSQLAPAMVVGGGSIAAAVMQGAPTEDDR